MANIQDKIDNIISELEFVKNNIEKLETTTEFCTWFRLALISKLEQTGAKYAPTLEHIWSHTGNNITENKKFFAFKISDTPTERETLNNLESVRRTLSSYMANLCDVKNLSFNIIKLEGLRDKDAFSDLIRGILIVKEVSKCE